MMFEQDKYLICEDCRMALDISQILPFGRIIFFYLLDHEGHQLCFSGWDSDKMAGCQVFLKYGSPKPEPDFCIGKEVE